MSAEKDNKAGKNAENAGSNADEKKKLGGLSLRKLNYLMSGVALTISVLLLISIGLTFRRYSSVRDKTIDYIEWQQSVSELREASDYLTEQVRSFAANAKDDYDRVYLDNYFIEAKESRRRDNSLAVLEEYIDRRELLEHLENAMDLSVELMNIEYYSMRLVINAKGLDVNDYPPEIRQVALSEEDKALPAFEQLFRADEMLFDNTYHEYKNRIYDEVKLAGDSLVDVTEENLANEMDVLTTRLILQGILTLSVIIVILTVIIVSNIQVINPLLKAVPNIKQDKSLPVSGSYEFRYLAETYNKMHLAHLRQQRKLSHEATHDALTGVFNRAGYEKIVASMYAENYAVLAVDVDDFKLVNDNHGHPVGDAVLADVASELKKVFRSNDLICRVGGDEFVVFMIDVTDSKNARAMIERKASVIRNALRSKQGIPPVSVSIGVAFASGDDDTEEAVKNADSALYKVKNNGKNGCAIFEGMNPGMNNE